MPAEISHIIALDVGEKRIGIAIASLAARLARPLTTIANDQHAEEMVRKICAENQVVRLVVGLPRGLNGQTTDQTAYTRQFGVGLEQVTGLPVHFQDEAVTSKQARAELDGRKKPYPKEAVDALAATYILEDYLLDRGGDAA